jgi:hypothetical protein
MKTYDKITMFARSQKYFEYFVELQALSGSDPWQVATVGKVLSLDLRGHQCINT